MGKETSRYRESAQRQAKYLYEKYLTVTATHLKEVPDERQKNLAMQLAYMEIQENRFNRLFTNKRYWLEVEKALYDLRNNQCVCDWAREKPNEIRIGYCDIHKTSFF